MFRARLSIAVAATVVGLTACGGSSEVTPASVAKDIGCTNVQADQTSELFVKDVAKCTLDGQSVRVYTFEDNRARDSYLDVARVFGVTYDKHDKALVSAS